MANIIVHELRTPVKREKETEKILHFLLFIFVLKQNTLGITKFCFNSRFHTYSCPKWPSVNGGKHERY